MLLVIDVGNTHTVIGVYEKTTLLQHWRIRTERNTTEDEFDLLFAGLLLQNGIQMDQINRTVISCVVPPVVGVLDAFCHKYLGHAPHWVDARSYKGMPVLYNNPEEVGADRIVNAVGAFTRYRKSLVIVDFGTATTFDAISAKGEYIGGAISPGLGISAEALFLKASKLPRVELINPPPKAIGQNTIHSIQAGLIFGYAAMVDGMVARFKTEMASDPKVIATGGLAGMMADVAVSIEAVDRGLTLEGLRIIGEVV